MPVEQATYINNLDKSWPLSQDGVNEGDNHLRLLKKVLQAQFPGSGGTGFNKAILATEDELNRLDGVSSNVQDQLDALLDWQNAAEDTFYAPQGTYIIFGENNVAPGWTVAHYGNTKSLIVIDPDNGGSPGWQGGVDDPASYIASHKHELIANPTIFGQQWTSGNQVTLVGEEFTKNGGVDWKPRYLEVVIAIKD